MIKKILNFVVHDVERNYISYPPLKPLQCHRVREMFEATLHPQSFTGTHGTGASQDLSLKNRFQNLLSTPPPLTSFQLLYNELDFLGQHDFTEIGVGGRSTVRAISKPSEEAVTQDILCLGTLIENMSNMKCALIMVVHILNLQDLRASLVT